MRVALGSIGILVLASVTGCSYFRPNELYSDYGVGELKINPNSASVQLKEAITKTSPGDRDHLVDSDCFAVPVDKANPATVTRCQQQRNASLVALLNASDDMCQAHLKTIFGNDASFNIISGSITNLAAGAATAATGLAAKTALSAVAFFSNAERSLVNETVYKNLLVNAVTTKIREARDAKAAVITPGNLTKDIDSYPMHMAVRDVITYHYTCSFMFGLEKALNEGIQPTLDSRKVKLEQNKQTLQIAIDTRAAKIGAEAAKTDEIIGGDKKLITAIDDELTNLIKAQK